MSAIKLHRAVNQVEQEELLKLRTEGLHLLQENNFPVELSNSMELAKSVRKFVDMYREHDLSPTAQEFDPVNLAYSIGELYAKAVIDNYGWTYQFLEFEDGFSGFAVVSPDQKWCILIHHYFHNLLHDLDKSNNSLLNYNMLEPQVLQKYHSDGFMTLS